MDDPVSMLRFLIKQCVLHFLKCIKPNTICSIIRITGTCAALDCGQVGPLRRQGFRNTRDTWHVARNWGDKCPFNNNLRNYEIHSLFKLLLVVQFQNMLQSYWGFLTPAHQGLYIYIFILLKMICQGRNCRKRQEQTRNFPLTGWPLSVHTNEQLGNVFHGWYSLCRAWIPAHTHPPPLPL